MPSPQPIAPQLIALDLDGTLLDRESKISPRNLATLLAAEAAGITVVIATGRRHFYALKVLGDLPLRPDTVLISSNGAVVRRFDSQLIEHTHMLPAAARWLVGHLGEFRSSLVLTFDRTITEGPHAGEDARGALVIEHLPHLNKSIGKWMEANEPYLLIADPIESCLTEEEPPIQAMLAGPVERMRRAEQHLLQDPQVAAVGEVRAKATIQLNRTEYPERDLSIVDILPAGCSKGAAILSLAARLNIPSSDIMCIGDNWNDLSMLEIAGQPILMANAPADLKQMAAQKGWHVTLSHAEDGVAEAIDQACPHLLTTPTPTWSNP